MLQPLDTSGNGSAATGGGLWNRLSIPQRLAILLSLVAGWFVFQNIETWWQTARLMTYSRPADWVPLEIADPCTTVALETDHALVIDAHGDVYSWGASSRGELGYKVMPQGSRPSSTYQETPRRVPLPSKALCISTSQSFVVALLEDGSIWYWGDFGPRYKTTHDYLRNENTDNPHRTFEPVLFLENTNAVAVVTHGDGGNYLTADGRVYQWGGEPLERGWDTHPYIWEPYEVEFPEPVAWIEARGKARVAITVTGDVYAWGLVGNFKNNEFKDFQRSPEPVQIRTPVPAVDAANGGSYFNILDRDGHVWTWGTDIRNYRDGTVNRFVEFERLPNLEGIQSIASPNAHEDTAVRHDGRLIIWGNKYYLVPPTALNPHTYPRLVDLPFRVYRVHERSNARIVEDRSGCYWATQRWAGRLRLHYGDVQGPSGLSPEERIAWETEQKRGAFQRKLPLPRYGRQPTTPIYRPDGAQVCARVE